jgi:hypothetical protein
LPCPQRKHGEAVILQKQMARRFATAFIMGQGKPSPYKVGLNSRFE